MQKVQDAFNSLAAEHRAEIMQMRRDRNREGLQDLQDKLAAEAESKVGKSGLTDDQLKIYSTIGGTPHLDGQYTVFGEVEEGLDVVEMIQGTATGRADRPKMINFASQRNVLIDKINDIMALFDQISEDIKSAMKARDKVRLETLRNIKKVFLEAKTAPGANDTLADADALKIISKLAKQGKETAATYTQAGRQDLADAELAQVEVLESYLPKQWEPQA